MTHITEIHNYLMSPLSGVSNVIYRLVNTFINSRMFSVLRLIRIEFIRHKDYRETYKELSKMTDRDLRDIGITREMIHEVSLRSPQNNFV